MQPGPFLKRKRNIYSKLGIHKPQSGADVELKRWWCTIYKKKAEGFLSTAGGSGGAVSPPDGVQGQSPWKLCIFNVFFSPNIDFLDTNKEKKKLFGPAKIFKNKIK